MDPGTAWEIGYAIAKGLPVFAWSTGSELLRARTQAYVGTRTIEGRVVDDKGWAIEDFDLVDNLMIAVPCDVIHKNADEAIAACANALKKGKHRKP